jgi:hypothetical protein
MFRAKRRYRKWKPKWKWERAQRKKLQMEEQLKEDLRPTDTLHCGGIVTKVHVVRTLSGRKEYHFEFGRQETDRKRFFFKPVFSEHDLLDLQQAVSTARTYRNLGQSALGQGREGFANGFNGTTPSKAFRSRLPDRWE